jgi:hypothetical protein
MGKPSHSTQGKRNRERAQKERQAEKKEQRGVRKDMRAERAQNVEDGIDPDLVGIYPGPQPIADEL